MNVGRFSVSNPVLVNITMAALLVMGAVSLSRIPREAMSNVDFSWVFIFVANPGVSAEEMEKSVTIRVEDEIADVDRIKQITSNTQEGLAAISVQFEDDLSRDDFLRLFQDLRAEFDKVELPESALEPYIDEFSSSDFMPMITVNLKGGAGDEVMNETARALRDRLLDIDDVSKVEIVGGRDREVWVEADRDRMDALGISMHEIVGALAARNVNIPGGVLETGTRAYLLQTVGQVKRPGDFGSVIVRRRPGGVVHVRDIATVNRGMAPAEYDVRVNGENAISLKISKKLRGNSIRVVDAIRAEVDRFCQTLPAGVSASYFNDTSVYIRDILSVLSRNAAAGFVTLVLVLFAFIGLRNSLVTALGIPITFAITFIFMESYGESLNGNSLFALVMVLGMIVDHAIVIIENAYRLRQQGLSAHDAAIQGTNEVIKPVLAGTATTVAAFLPLMLLPGIMGKFMRIIPIVTCLALVASTLEALFLLPSHFADWGGNGTAYREGIINRFQARFRAVVSAIFRHRYIAVAVTALVFVLSAGVATLVRQDLFAGEDFAMFYVDIRLPVGTPREVTNEVASRFEQRLLPLVNNGEVVSVTTTVGFMETDDEWITKSSVAQIVVDIAERSEARTRPVRTIMEETRALCADIPGAQSVNYRMLSSGPPVEKPVTFRIEGDDYDETGFIAEDYVRFLRRYESDTGLYNISHDFEQGFPELRVVVDEERAARFGLDVATIGLYVRACFEGVTATTYFEQDDEIDVVVKWAEPYRVRMEDITQMTVPSRHGAMVPLAAVASVEHGRGLAAIKRTDRARQIMVTADTHDKEFAKRVVVPAIAAFFTEKFARAYPEVSIEFGGEFKEFGEVMSNLLRLLGVGVFLMYVILGAQFKSFFQPLIIGAAVFFAFVGCVLYLVVSGTALSVVVMFAGVALTGICVNDSIVLISFINGLRRTGMGVAQAVEEGCAVRLRPIILTSVTTIGGLLPMAVGIGGKSPIWAPMASTIMFGLAFSTVGTLLVIPCLYGILADVSAKLGFAMKLEGE